MMIQACKVYLIQLLACGTIFSQMDITDSGSVTWYEPPPVETTSDENIELTADSRQLRKGSTHVQLSWSFSLTPDLSLITVVLTLNDVHVATVVPSTGNAGPALGFEGRFNVTGTSQKATLIIFNVTADDDGEFGCGLNTFEGVQNKIWKRKMKVEVVAPPVISGILGERIVNDTDSVNLTCKADGKPTPNITWTRVSDNTSVIFPFTLSGKPDEGLYRCTADNGIGNPARRDVFVTVQYYRPIETNLRTSLRDKAIVANTSFSITCSSKANPPAKYRFYKDQENFFSDTTGSDVSIITTSFRERTEKVNISCTPFNDFGVGISDGLTLTVLYAPDKATLTTVPSNRTLLRGSIMTFNCKTAASPKAEYHFYFNGTFIGNSSTGVLRVSVKEDGVYTCVPRNTVGTGDNATVSITVVVAASVEILVPTAIVVEGGGLALACNASGKPQPSVTWTKLGSSEVLSNTSSLTIVNVIRPGTPDNMIQYQCTASNGIKSPAAVTATISVHYPPSITNEGNETFNVEVGKEVKFLCLGDGNPTPAVNWTSEDGVIDGTLSKNMNNVAFDANVDSSGLYLCTIKNYLGEDFKWFRVVVESKNILIMLTITNKGCNDDSQEISEQLRTNVEDLLRPPHKQLKAVKLIDVRCGSVTVYLSLEFNENVKITEVLSVLKNATSPETKGFGEFDVDSGSIRAISQDELPTDSFIGTTVSPINTQDPTGDKQCECSCKDGLFGAIIGILVFIIIILIIYILWLHKKGTSGTSRTKRRYEDVRGVYDNEIALSDVEASNVVPTNSTQPRSEYMDLTEATTENSETKRSAQSADYAPLHPLTLSWEVARQHLTIEKIIGKGAFGQVAKGTAIGLRGKPGKTTVAVKMLKYNSPESDRRDLLKELDTMKQLKPHPHVIKLLGCVTETEPLMVIIEYVPYGDLLGYLRKSRGLNDTYYKDPDIKPETSLTSQQLMKFAWQIADGMSYLSSQSIIHRDLAARNVLVGERETCKVTDFGMARDVQQENIYERKTKGRLPVKWTAYEALLYGTYTTKSDIWSYGVVLYEIFTIGGSPYPRMNGKRIANLLQEGYRMPKPQHVDDKLYEIMLKCWQNDPDVRPTFSDLKTQLKDMENQHRRLINMKMYDRQFYANLEDLVV